MKEREGVYMGFDWEEVLDSEGDELAEVYEGRVGEEMEKELNNDEANGL